MCTEAGGRAPARAWSSRPSCPQAPGPFGSGRLLADNRNRLRCRSCLPGGFGIPAPQAFGPLTSCCPRQRPLCLAPGSAAAVTGVREGGQRLGALLPGCVTLTRAAALRL